MEFFNKFVEWWFCGCWFFECWFFEVVEAYVEVFEWIVSGFERFCAKLHWVCRSFSL